MDEKDPFDPSWLIQCDEAIYAATQIKKILWQASAMPQKEVWINAHRKKILQNIEQIREMADQLEKELL